MQAEPLLALRALRDCRVVRATWSHPGYRELRHRGLATFAVIPGKADHIDHRLTQRGVIVANAVLT